MSSKPLPPMKKADCLDTSSVISSDPPPSYREHNVSRTYHIGTTHLSSPLVQVTHLKAHLDLLRAFKNLRMQIVERPGDQLPRWVGGSGVENRWTMLVALAVERFQIWIEAINKRAHPVKNLTLIPPIDVLMVWHSYMLNPSWYAEDGDRILLVKNFQAGHRSLLDLIMTVENISTHQPSDLDVQSWQNLTGTPYDIFDAFVSMSEHTLICPYCLGQVSAAFSAARSSGYFERALFFECPWCRSYITRNGLAVLKLAKDLVPAFLNSKETQLPRAGDYLAGTLRTTHTKANTTVARWIQATVVEQPGLVSMLGRSEEDIIRHIVQATGGHMHVFKSFVEKTVKYSESSEFDRMFSAYVDDRPFSVELPGAIMRQCLFIDKMHDLGWTEHGFFDDPEDEQVLAHALARYHAFLDLMTLSLKTMLVPTLDIDLVWHTHQLMGNVYFDDCMNLIGRFIDHDDKIRDDVLSSSFDTTCRLWENEFGIPYSHCGCPLPGRKIGDRLTRLTRGLTASLALTQLPSHPSALRATHPSDHNTYHPSSLSAERARHKLRDKMWKRQMRDGKLVKKGAMSREVYERGRKHDPAFLLPVPLFSRSVMVKSPVGLSAVAAVAGGVTMADMSGLGCAADGYDGVSSHVGDCYSGTSACGSSCSGGCGGGGSGCGGGGCGGG